MNNENLIQTVDVGYNDRLYSGRKYRIYNKQRIVKTIL